MNEAYSPEENEWLELLRASQSTLAKTIDSLDVKSIPKWEVRYFLWAAVSVNQSALGYLVLRQENALFASKLLIRPMLETFLSAQAVLIQHGFLFRKIYTEVCEFSKLDPNATDAELKEAIKKYIGEFKAYDKSYPCVQKTVSMSYTAEVAKMVDHYQFWYRIYCKYTHGAQIAITGVLNQATDDLDTPMVTELVSRTLEQLERHTHAKIDELGVLRRRYNILSHKLKAAASLKASKS
jgi:hypothetical protein